MMPGGGGIALAGAMMPAGGGPGGCCMDGQSARTSQIHFRNPEGMQVRWDVSQPGAFDGEPLVAPGRYNFPQAAMYRLKLTDIPGRPGVELYPTMELGPATPRTEAYLAHNMIPFELTEEDLDQVLSGNFVTKVIYLPDPEHQELALAGVETLVSTRLDPGVDPIVEADRKGSILAVIRVGNKDLELPGSEGNCEGGVAQAGYCDGAGGCPDGSGGYGGNPNAFPHSCLPGAVRNPGGPVNSGFVPPPYVSGVSVPQYGMPSCGTPIGLPGPPHIPLGGPAGLQAHIIKNNTHVSIPGPVKKFKVNVKQTPGFSYPKPPSHMSIHEHVSMPPVQFRQPHSDRFEHANDVENETGAGGDCYGASYNESCGPDGCQ
jgi:hypothetical protein